jgi:small redox-active disulfide protein 2
MNKFKANIMEIKILGTGCASCHTLEKQVLRVVEEMQIPASVSKEEDIMAIMSYGVLRTPGLVINNKVVFSGRVPTEKEIKEAIDKHLQV